MDFETLWREASTRETYETKVRLACCGDVVSIGSVELLGLRDAHIQFTCPRCNERHESPPLR